VDWTGGLTWHEPLELTDGGDEDVTVAAVVGVINAAEQQIEQARGNWHRDTSGVLDELFERALERFASEELLACEHVDEPGYTSYLASAVLAAVCDRAACRAAMEVVIDGAERWRHCLVCADRSDHLGVTLAVMPVAGGKFMAHVHTCHLQMAQPA
jgi:hypothetical protein